MLIQMLRALFKKMLPRKRTGEKYRPERHYMRGPGPKAKASKIRQSPQIKV